MSDTLPESRTCSGCGHELKPVLHGYTVDKDYNSVPLYMFGHQCPKLLKAGDDRRKEIISGDMNQDQKRNALRQLDYQNIWSN